MRRAIFYRKWNHSIITSDLSMNECYQCISAALVNERTFENN